MENILANLVAAYFIRQCGDSRFAVRDRAARQMEAVCMMRHVVPALNLGVAIGDPEQRARCLQVLAKYRNIPYPRPTLLQMAKECGWSRAEYTELMEGTEYQVDGDWGIYNMDDQDLAVERSIQALFDKGMTRWQVLGLCQRAMKHGDLWPSSVWPEGQQ